MQEKDILLDLLSGTKHSINCYTNAIMEGSNQQLRSTFQTLRDEAEQMQHQLYQMAEQKGFYHAAPTANQNDIQHIKSSLTNNLNGTNTNMNMNYAGGGQTNQNQNVMSDTNSHAMINSNMMNTTNATSSISTNTANNNNSNSKKSKKK